MPIIPDIIIPEESASPVKSRKPRKPRQTVKTINDALSLPIISDESDVDLSYLQDNGEVFVALEDDIDEEPINPLDHQLNLNLYSNIVDVVPSEYHKDLPSIDNVFKNTIPENYELVLNKFYPYITDRNIYGADYDVSFDALYYLGLGGLGGKYVTWHLNREIYDPALKKKLDYHSCQCDANHTHTFEIDVLLNYAIDYANKHIFSPPAAIYAMAGHPNCKCVLVFDKATNFSGPEDISDSCPGVPSNGTPEQKLQAKKEIFDNIFVSKYR
jgi:hypothetical protein